MTEPVPTSHNGKIDPSKLTTDAVRAAVEESRRDLVASEKLAAGQIKRIEDVNKERFHSIANEFQLVERGRIEQNADTKQAVDAALIAQKEAVKAQTVASEKAIDKSEKTTA